MKRLAILALVACGSPAKTAEEEFTAWMPKDAARAWQGAWVLRLEEDGPLVAVDIAGERATIFDGRDEKQATFKVVEPCAVAFIVGATSRELQFLIKDGKVVAGRGAVAYRKGDSAIACGDGHDPDSPEEGVYTIRGNHCTTWKRDAKGAWRGRDGVCVWANARGDDLLEAGTEHYYSSMILHGDVAEEREFTKSAKDDVHMATWAEAKAAVTAAAGTPSRLDAAKAAGGVVGDTKTIAGLAATYADRPATLVGEDLEVPGTLVETSTQTVQGHAKGTFAVITDASKMQLTCATGVVTGIANGDAVVVKGHIDTSTAELRLRPCEITKAP